MSRSGFPTISFWQRSSRQDDVRCDIAVVGGGIVGASSAYWLKRHQPELDVVLVESERLAAGASGRNAGFLLQGTSSDFESDVAEHGIERTRRLWHFSQENRDLILQELSPRAFHLETTGSLTVAGSHAEDERLRRAVSGMRAAGFPVAYIREDETNRRLVARGFLGSLYMPSGAMLHPVLLVRHIAERSGARLLEGHRVLEIAGQENDVTLETPERRIHCKRVVVALNAYLPHLVPSLSRYVSPVRAQMLATEPMPSRWLQVPAYTHEGYYYLRQSADGSVLLGGARHRHDVEERGYVDTTTRSLQADLETFLHGHFPQTEGLRIQQRWSGVMGFSPDGLPVVGEVPEIAGSYYATGFTGHGMGYGFRFGRMMAEMMQQGLEAVDADLFDSSRFDSLPRPGRLRLAST